ncbi:MAG TPA: hypothetical protein VJ717_15645 [Gemmatimonadaceae bacterium]|nr:hypothetical protein [Gemmatimonadaceae bacterium]
MPALKSPGARSSRSASRQLQLVRQLCALFTLPLIGSPIAHAQHIPLRELPKPAQELEEPFSFVSTVTEIGAGRVIAIDGLEAELFVVDFAKGTRTKLGRQGTGPGEYRIPAGIFRVQGDTIWVLDAAQMRIVAFNPDLTPGTAFPFLMFDQQSSSTLSAPFFNDSRGRLYAGSMTIQAARSGSGGSMSFPDSVVVVRVNARDKSARTELARIRFRVSGKPEMQVSGSNIKYKMAFPGLVASDAWTVFPDGRIAIIRGASYSVEFINSDGKRIAPVQIAYERIRVTDEDKKAEMDEARREIAEQQKAMRKVMPANVNMTFELTPPDKWPNEYPPVAGVAALPAPNGSLWIKRAIPVRRGREQWDVIDRSGKLAARWLLPRKTTIAAVGPDMLYAVRTDEDDLRYLQRVQVPK